MKRTIGLIKLVCVMVFAAAALMLLLFDSQRVVRPVEAFGDGPPAGHTGAPGEQTCSVCHFDQTAGAQFSITPPTNYVPGQTYQITVQHINPDPSRQRWGFQLTALAGVNMAGTLASTNMFTQIVGGTGGRDYVEHTGAGTFPGTTGGAQWVFNWTAPSSNVGAVTFYAAGNQANGDGTASGDRVVVTTATSQPQTPQASMGSFDFDGDGKTDIGIFRPAPAEWWINRSSNGSTFAAQFGATTDDIVPGDYTGDGKVDIAIYRAQFGDWYILRSEDFSFFAFPFGADGGDVPTPADFDGDDKTDAAVFRPSNSTWFIRRSTDGGTTIEPFGALGDKPVASDYDGDGKADIAIWRPSLGQWWMQRSTAGLLAVTFGTETDKTVQGDYTGDGKSDVAFWRPSTGQWFILRSEDFSFFAVPFGNSSDTPAPGDYDGDGKSDTAVFRPSEATWYIDRSTAGIQIVPFGASGDRPVSNAFVR